MEKAAKAKMDEETRDHTTALNEEDDEATEKARRKAEKKAPKAEKEAKKLAKLTKEAADEEEDVVDGGKEGGDQEGDGEDEVFYGAPDDHAWTDSSHAMKEAEQKKDDGPDLSVSIKLYY